MTPLSPQAQAVLAAIESQDGESDVAVAAAVLRIAASSVASPIPDGCTADVFNRQIEIRRELLAIAAELEAQQ